MDNIFFYIIIFLLGWILMSLKEIIRMLYIVKESNEKLSNELLDKIDNATERIDKSIFNATEETSHDINYFRKLSGARTDREEEEFLYESTRKYGKD